VHNATIGAFLDLATGFGRSISELCRWALILAVIKTKSSVTSNAAHR
jgi:hypothetical protein